ncbi:MAG: molybdopterin dinucleotide binding domain-containing protein [Fervidicoccaceae archaeon]
MSVKISRRTYIKGALAAATLAVFLGSYWEVIDKIIRPKRQFYEPDPQFGDNVRYVFSACLGCNVRCGIVARVMKYGDVEVIERILGNPYHPYNRAVSLEKQINVYEHLPYTTPVKEALEKWSGRLCPRGVDGIHYVYDPYRVLKPLRRAGPRGSGKWKVISWEELIRCVVEGCTIPETGERLPGLKEFFVYGKLRDAGFEDPNKVLSDIKKDSDAILAIAKDPSKTYDDILKAIEDFKAKWSKILGEKGLKLEDILINPDRPDLGTKANMIIWLRGRGQDNADIFYRRWIYAFGSVNWTRHTSACQLGYYAGNYLWSGYYDIEPDQSARVLIVAGAEMGRAHPGATGQGLLIEKAANGELKLYYVNPIAPRTRARGNIVWVPVKPGEDAALAFAMIRWMLENKRYNEDFLSAPHLKAAEKLGYPVHTNATWLVIFEEGHPRFGEFLKAKDINLEASEKPVVWTGNEFAVYDSVDKAELHYEGRVTLATGETVTVKTAFKILYDEAFSRTFEEWLAIASPYKPGTSRFIEYVETVRTMVKDFADAAPMAATWLHRGVGMHTNGEYTVWSYRILDTLIGNYHRKGGLLGRPSTTSYNSYLYDLRDTGFGEPVRWGPPIDRHRYMYEDTLEYWLRVKKALKEGRTSADALKEAFPTRRPWYPHTPEEIYTEIFAGIAEGYPYPAGVLILYYANPVLASNYGVKYIEVLKDTRKLPLFIGITTTINETYLYADYIVPDTTYLETGTLGVQFLYAAGLGVSRAETWRSPVIMPLTQYIGTCPNGHPRYASMWEFLIDTAKTLGMPGYGDKAFKGTTGRKYEGQWFSLHCLWEYIMRVYANAAAHAKDLKIIPENVPADEVEFVEKNYPIARFKDLLPPDEWGYVAYGLARGGVFTSYEDSFDARGISKRSVPGDRVLKFWNEKLAMTRNSATGEKFYGGPRYFPVATYAPIPGLALAEAKKDRWLHGTPLRQVYKQEEWPFTLVFGSGPLFTKHRSQFYYWLKQITPENFVILNPEDAARYGVETGDIIRVETPEGSIEVPAVVSTDIASGSIYIPYGMGRWADTVTVKPKYLKVKKFENLADEIPELVEIPEDAVNPVRKLPSIVKKILFTKSPAEYYEKGLMPDKWRFNGVTPNPIEATDPSLEGWPLLSWLGGGQAYFETPARIANTGRKHKFESPYIVW